MSAGASPGTLYLVATPIGNPEDVSLRALRVLREVAVIAAEDARVTRKLLSRYDIATQIVSYRPRRDADVTETLLARLRAGEDLALVSDAGTPLLADPGRALVSAALAMGASVTAVPGASAALAALVISGLPASRFVFEGFPPRTRAARRRFFDALAQETRTILLYESPSHLKATLLDLCRVVEGARPLVLARDLTKRSEAVFRGTLAEAEARFHTARPRGEITLVLAGKGSVTE